MSLYDYVLLAIIAYFIYRGARSGFIAILGGFIGIILGAWAAGHYYDFVAQWLVEYFDASIMVAIVISFIAIYLAVNLLVGIFVKIIMTVFRIIPLATFTNRLIGGALGLLEGLLLIGLIIWIINLFPFENAFAQGLEESRVAKYFEYSTGIVRPLIPKDLRNVDLQFLQDLDNLTEEKAEYLKNFMPRLFEKVQQKRENLQQRYDTVIEESTSTK